MDGYCWMCKFCSYSIVNFPVISLAQDSCFAYAQLLTLPPDWSSIPNRGSDCSPCEGSCRLCPVFLPISAKDLLEERGKRTWPYLLHVASPAQKQQLLLPIEMVVSVATVTAISPDKWENCISGAHCSPSLVERETTHMTSFPFGRLTEQKWFEPV